MAEIEEDEPPGVPEWVVTYGDMMSLLLTFFIMLVSLSETKEEGGQLRAMMDSIKQTFGPTRGRASAPGPSSQSTSQMKDLYSKGMTREGGNQRGGGDKKGTAGAHRTVKRINHGTLVTIGGPALFERFEASTNEALKSDLDVLARVLASKPNRLVIRGHASAERISPDCAFSIEWANKHGRLPDRMDLSFARARMVAKYLMDKGISSQRLIVSAAGASEPRTVTRSESEQKLNRRVDVFLIDSYITSPRSSTIDSK